MAKKIKALMSWKIKEFEKSPKSFKVYLILYLVLISLVVYGLISNNLLLSILVILIGFSFFIFEKKEPEDVIFAITEEGILIQNELHAYESLKSFWIDYEPGNNIKELSIKTEQIIVPYLKISLNDKNPNEVRKILLKYLPEEEHPHSLMSIFDKF